MRESQVRVKIVRVKEVPSVVIKKIQKVPIAISQKLVVQFYKSLLILILWNLLQKLFKGVKKF